jgi:5,10-methenyltetrahydrofolate synthetase
MTKAEIRALIAERKKSFQGLEVLSAAVVKNFQGLEIFKTAKTVGAYMPLPSEVDITPLFQSLDPSEAREAPQMRGSDRRERQKIFYIPAFDEASGGYRMARLTTELKKGRFGIPEPAVPVFAAADELDLIIVPSMAFDRAGHRIGRGGGFYDRLLPQYRAVRAGICFGFQCLETVPAQEHDIRMDWVVTETQILKIELNS